MADLTALYAACVLHPASLRDLLIRLARAGLFGARWTNAIHEEWMRSVLAERPHVIHARLERTRDLMNASVRDCLVTGYEDLIETVTLPDPDDRHVLAAAIRCGANVIVTFNLTDFPTSVLQGYGIAAQHPDAFVCHLLDLDPAAVCGAVTRQREALKNPPQTAEQLLDTLEGQRLVRTVARLRPLIDLL